MPSPELERIRDEAQAELRANAFLLYRHALTWNDGTTCRCSVRDPGTSEAGANLARRLTGLTDVLSVRIVTVHPDDPKPGTGASVAWDGGTLTLTDWSTPSDFTGQAYATGRFTR